MHLMRIGLLIVFGASSAATAQNERSILSTVAEKSDFQRTGRYEEVITLCHEYQKHWSDKVRCFEFGRTPEGRAMLALAVSSDGVLDAKSARAKRRPVVLAQGGIHAGEIDGKDAGFLAIRAVLEGTEAKDSLRKTTFVFVPVFNIDGHERFGPNNRPNQIGPIEMGWRTTAQNLNLNRDYIKADAPEMQAMLRLLNEWDPLVYVDLHVTDGAEFEHDISINVAPTLTGENDLRQAANGLRKALMDKLRSTGSQPVDFYPSFVKDDDPSSGFAASVSPPRFSHEYWAKRNRIGVLVETHSWKNYKTRVMSTYHSLIGLFDQVASHGDAWLAVVKDLDNRAPQNAGREIPLVYGNTSHFSMIDFRGYRYSREVSPISGGLVTRYDNRYPEIWHIPFFDEVRPIIAVRAPRGGYVVPASWSALVGEKLALHGVNFLHISKGMPAHELEVFRASVAQLSTTTTEGHATLALQGEWHPENRAISKGSLFVPIAQPHAEFAVILLEPKSPDSLVSWGFLSTAFERKEYMEVYVAEQVATQMLAKDSALKAEFERRLKEDPAFAANPQARLDFFYRRHPSWDERFNLYPIFRTDDSGFAAR